MSRNFRICPFFMMRAWTASLSTWWLELVSISSPSCLRPSPTVCVQSGRRLGLRLRGSRVIVAPSVEQDGMPKWTDPRARRHRAGAVRASQPLPDTWSVDIGNTPTAAGPNTVPPVTHGAVEKPRLPWRNSQAALRTRQSHNAMCMPPVTGCQASRVRRWGATVPVVDMTGGGRGAPELALRRRTRTCRWPEAASCRPGISD